MSIINKVDQITFAEVEGIGEVTAQNIIEYRAKKGGFSSPEELKMVKGIGNKKYKNIIDYLGISQSETDSEELHTTDSKESSVDPGPETQKVLIEFKPDEMGIEDPEEVHLVGDMNDWDPADKSFSLTKDEEGVWRNEFHLKPGMEYKFMYDSTSWEEDKHIGFFGENFVVE